MKNSHIHILTSGLHARAIVPHDASIPTKYQTIVLDNSDKKGFNSQARRFNDNLTDVPGPGRYKMKKGFETCSASYSKKGTGSFASTSSRTFWRRYSNNIGPDMCTYNVQLNMLSSNKRPSPSFASPLAPMRENVFFRKNSFAPAPNRYFQNLTQTKKSGKFSNKPFNSTGRRICSSSKKPRAPSPCHYNIRENATTSKTPALTSMFASKTNRIHDASSNVPGPGSYRPNEPVKDAPNKQLMPRKHYLAISAPAIKLPENIKKQVPGPGHYDPRDSDVTSMTSAFVSNTSRRLHNVKELSPGPAKYMVATKSCNKESFMFNVHKRWVPA